MRVALAVCCLLGNVPVAAQDDAALLARGRLLFTQGTAPSCALCHTLKDAGTHGAIGPVLDELQPDASRVASALRSGIGAMPSYRATLDDAQIAALARYVAKASGAAP
ncbi:MAG: cytochrome c [Deltaproteobacteria bacterium]|nr:cytochrome c [Nannocystaceae bacterium]